MTAAINTTISEDVYLLISFGACFETRSDVSNRILWIRVYSKLSLEWKLEGMLPIHFACKEGNIVAFDDLNGRETSLEATDNVLIFNSFNSYSLIWNLYHFYTHRLGIRLCIGLARRNDTAIVQRNGEINPR